MINIGKTSQGIPANLNLDVLTTHAAVVGSTGSGKSGLLLSLAEEVAQKQLPVILVDIKGDIVNIALQRTPSNFEVRCLTPGAFHGEPIDVFADLQHKGKIATAVSSVLHMIDCDTDPLKSKDHAYLSTILTKRHAANKPCELLDIIHAVQDPGFNHLGAMDLDFAYPKRSRIALASKLNNLLVAPTFQPWREGIPLNIEELLTSSSTPVIVYSVAHLVSQTEQAFALSILFEEIYRWIRTQPGSNNLKSILIVDECVGLIPPHPANPPTKKPLLLLLKQARAFGMGIVLATQNTVDIDYKAMANCGTWFIGRLSMDKDRARVIKGVCANTPIPESTMASRIASLQPREFVVVRPKGLLTVTTKDTNCDLIGPVSPDGISDMYSKGQLIYGSDNISIHYQLQMARKALDLDSSDENLKKVAELETKLKMFNSNLILLNGGKK